MEDDHETRVPFAMGFREARPGRPALFSSLILLGLACFLAAGLFRWYESARRSRDREDGRDRVQSDARRAAWWIDGLLKDAPALAQKAAEQAARLRPDAVAVDELLRQTLADAGARSISWAGVAFEPSAVAPLPAPLFRTAHRSGASIVTKDAFEPRLPYTAIEHRWYGDALLDSRSMTVPVMAPGGTEMVAIFGHRFAAPGNPPGGVAYVAVSLADVTAALEKLKLDTRGYAYVFSSEGAYVSHPQLDLVGAGSTVFKSALQSGNTDLNSKLIQAARTGKSDWLELTDPISRQKSWIAFHRVPAAGWTVAVVNFQQEHSSGAHRRHRRSGFWIVALLVLGVGLIGWALTIRLVERQWLWATSWTMTAAILAGVFKLWLIQQEYPPIDDYGQINVDGDAATEQFLQVFASDEKGLPGAIETLRVGLFISSIAFKSAIDVDVKGYLWHEEPAAAAGTEPADGRRPGPARAGSPADDNGPRVVLADAITSDFKAIARRPSAEEGVDLTVWEFTATLREHFSYERYPFDEQQIWVRIRGSDPMGRLVCIPDFKSYPRGSSLPGPAHGRATGGQGFQAGVDSEIVVPDWHLVGSNFDFRVPDYTATFGDQQPRASLPELYFNVRLQRRFLGPFVSYILPLSAVASMLFALLLVSSKREMTLSGFSATSIVQGVAALFFVVSYQHIALRTSLGSSKLIYLEYYYFVSYLMLLAVAADAILLSGPRKIALVEFRDNLIAKLGFWPATMALLFVGTFASLS